MGPLESSENQSMLACHTVDHANTIRTKDACDNVEENNNNINNNIAAAVHEKQGITQYSSNSKGVFAQCLVTGAVLLLAAGGGMPIGYSAILLPQLYEDNGTMYVDRELGSWIASIHSLATPVGSLVSGPFLDTIGRRGCLQLAAIPLCLGWIIIGFANNVSCILFGRVVAGLAVGLMAVPSQVLVSEVADPGLRGFLNGGSFASYCFGILLIYAFGASFRWDIVAFCGILLPVLALIALCFVPESPAWLVRRRKTEKARKALLWLRGGDMEQVNVEIAVLEARMKADVAWQSTNVSLKQQCSSAIYTLLDPAVLKPLTIINIFNALQLTSGTYVIVFYAVDLVKDIGGDTINNYLAAVVTAIIRFFFCLVMCVLLLRTGRRTLGMFSALGTAFASLILAGYMLARKEESFIDDYILGICLLMYVGTNTLGLLILPGLMTGELLPQRARGIGGGCNFFIFNFLVFVVTKCFPAVSNAVGVAGVFAIFGASALLMAVFIYITLPETKDRTLQEIEDYFQQDNVLWVTRSKGERKNDALIVRNP